MGPRMSVALPEVRHAVDTRRTQPQSRRQTLRWRRYGPRPRDRGTVVLLVLSLIFGRNFFNDLGVEPATGVVAAPMSAADSASEEKEVQFISFVLDDVQATWATILPNFGANFHPARLVLFRNSTDSGCGTAQSVMGPFYCPVDERAYLDLGFFEELKQRFSASGDFAQAYVLAHELGHHIQHLLARTPGSVGCRNRIRLMRTSSQSASSYRRIAMPECGHTRRINAACSSGATLTRRSTRRLPSRRPDTEADDGTHKRRLLYPRIRRAAIRVV